MELLAINKKWAVGCPYAMNRSSCIMILFSHLLHRLGPGRHLGSSTPMHMLVTGSELAVDEASFQELWKCWISGQNEKL